MTEEEFFARAREVQSLDKDLWKDLRALYVDRGIFQQFVRAVLDLRGELQENLANGQIVSDESVRKAIGMQGQIMGVNQVLALAHSLMQQPEEAPDEQT